MGERIQMLKKNAAVFKIILKNNSFTVIVKGYHLHPLSS